MVTEGPSLGGNEARAASLVGLALRGIPVDLRSKAIAAHIEARAVPASASLIIKRRLQKIYARAQAKDIGDLVNRMQNGSFDLTQEMNQQHLKYFQHLG